MNAIRFRAFFFLFLTGTVPLTALAIGLRYLPGSLLPWIAYLLGVIGVVMASIIFSGIISRPVKDAIMAMATMLKSGGNQTLRGWVPVELRRLHDGISQVNAAQRSEFQRLRQELDTQQHLVGEAELAAIRSLEVLQSVVDHSSEGIAFMHSSGHVALLGRAVVELFELEGECAQPGVDAKAWLNTIAMKMRGGANAAKEWMTWQTGPSSEMEGEWEFAATSQPRTLQVKSFDVRNESQGSMGRLWIFREITEQQRMNSRLQEAQKMESIGMLAGGIAHDFNNLLTAIRGNLALMDLEKDSAGRQDKLAGANQAAGKAAELVNRLLTFSRKQPLSKGSADVRQAALDVQTILRASLDPKVQLRVHLDDLSWKVATDPTDLEQILINLCINARDSLTTEGGIIQITADPHHQTGAETDPLSQRLRQPGDYVLLSVRDTGHGIPEEMRTRIFEAFFTTKEEGQGTGLGLAMVQNIVTEAGGWIEFDSVLGQGTEFRVFLPRCERKAEAQKPAPVTGPLKAGSAEGSILVVDDEAAVRSIAVHMLKYLGYNVLEAGDGEEALEIVSRSRNGIDAIMMDVYMPKLSGRDTFKALRQRGHQTPVIVCSGFNVEEDEFANLAGGQNGPIEVIQKPYSMDRLAGAVARAVETGHSITA